MIRVLSYIAIGLIAWDAVLHLNGLLFIESIDVTLQMRAELPWVLWPMFSSRLVYDLFWLALHALAALVLFIQMQRTTQ